MVIFLHELIFQKFKPPQDVPPEIKKIFIPCERDFRTVVFHGFPAGHVRNRISPLAVKYALKTLTARLKN